MLKCIIKSVFTVIKSLNLPLGVPAIARRCGVKYRSRKTRRKKDYDENRDSSLLLNEAYRLSKKVAKAFVLNLKVFLILILKCIIALVMFLIVVLQILFG